MTKTARKRERQQEISKECHGIYDEICDLREHFNWTQKELCGKAYREMYDEGEEEDKEVEKLHAKFKKIFQRKAWENNEAKLQTLKNLTELRDAIYCTDDYRHSTLSEDGSTLKPYMRKKMVKESEKLKKWLIGNLRNDDEN